MVVYFHSCQAYSYGQSRGPRQNDNFNPRRWSRHKREETYSSSDKSLPRDVDNLVLEYVPKKHTNIDAAACATTNTGMVYHVPADRQYVGARPPARFAGKDVPIVIDNGTSQCRAGYADSERPHLIFDSLYSKYRNRTTNRTYQVVGEDVLIDPLVRGAAKTPFDGTIITNWDAMEGILDYIFLHLGLEGQRHVNPIVLTETLCNLRSSRKTMTELLFECYAAPSIAYGIDSLFSFYQNGGRDGVIIGSGNYTSHVIPVFEGQAQIQNAKRLSLGGSSVPDYMLRLAQLKYPSFPLKVSPSQAARIARDQCYVSRDFQAELRHLLGDKFREIDRTIQFPFVDTSEPEKSAEELAIIAQRKFESGVRLREAAAAKRLEKLIQQEQDLQYYQDIMELKSTMTKKDFLRKLQTESIDNEAALSNRIATLESLIKKARNKDLGIVEEEVKQAPDFSLVDVPDDQLDEAQIKQKRTQKLMKYGYDARMRAKAEKEAERARLEEVARLDLEKREKDPQSWVQQKRAARSAVLDKIRSRQKLKADLNDRKSLASQMRMKQIAGLAATNDGKKRRKNDDDDFGMNDEDWHVYRDVANDSDSEGEEEENVTLRALEQELLKYDPSFTENDTVDAKADPSKSLLHAFYHGPYDPAVKKHELAMDYQLHLNVERIRAPEIVFRPSLVGMDQCGLVEMTKDILTRVEATQRVSVVREFFTTGGNTLLKGFNERLQADLQGILPADQRATVRAASDPILDAWRGAAKWAHGDVKYKHSRVTRAEYDEMGADYIKEHGLGNLQI